jgi:hypothetical protein
MRLLLGLIQLCGCNQSHDTFDLDDSSNDEVTTEMDA